MRSSLIWSVAVASLSFACSGSNQAQGSSSSGLSACDPDPAKRTEKCVDDKGVEICPMGTQFDGDGLRVCEPDPSQGMLLHYGPKNYDDPNEIALYTLDPGGEDENCTYIRTPNTEEVYVDSYAGRLRPHSHHLIVTMLDEAGFTENETPAACALLDVVGARWLVGSQSPQIDVTVSGASKNAPPAEQSTPSDPDYGLYQVVPPKTPLRMDLHYVNPTDKTILREAWVSFTTTTQAKAKTEVDMITLFQGQIKIPANSGFTTVRARCEAKSDRYLGLVTGHAHSRMTRESVWHEKADKSTELVYETYDWEEPGNLFYRKGPANPTPDASAKRMGGAAGYQLIKQGEALTFECEYKNTTNAVIKLGETTKTEMCNVFGMYYPSDGASWTCACLGTACMDSVPPGFSIEAAVQ
jgi:hypothetical protein